MVEYRSYLVFGPVPSRRLGKSLGINNIPPKVCTYSCVYCQVGRTLKMEVQRSQFYDTQEVVQVVSDMVTKLQSKNEMIDYLSFVPDGEPTLDLELGEKIRQLKFLGIKIAVISNASLIGQERVREALKQADWVSLKIDAITPSVWRKIDRPHRSLKLEKILEGIENFSQDFQGDLNTETMLVRDMNDQEEELHQIAKFIAKLDIQKSYLSIPTRPPTLKWVQPPEPEKITIAYQIFKKYALLVECLLGFAVESFGSTGDIERDLLSITSVHPMRESEIKKYLKKTEKDWQVIEHLIHEKKLIQTVFGEQKFYVRNFSGRRMIKSNGE
jgi:wyosine [tRNA(Phe)-imidazoG37] synthetase (radical SAM superfamily)